MLSYSKIKLILTTSDEQRGNENLNKREEFNFRPKMQYVSIKRGPEYNKHIVELIQSQRFLMWRTWPFIQI